MDTLASHTGLEFTRWVLAPGKWISERVGAFWDRYIYFVGIREAHDRLAEDLHAARLELAGLREDAAEAKRLRALLAIIPPADWSRQAARIISHRLGPNAALETVLIDRGSLDGIAVNTPVATPGGVIGRVLRVSPKAANVLLITDPNSRIPVTSQKNRTQGILKGEGPNRELVVQYVPLGSPIEEGEILVTSGIEEIFPKGLPAARVTRVARSGSSLFQIVFAEPLFDPRRIEEVALLHPTAQAPPATPAARLEPPTAPIAPAAPAAPSAPPAKPGQAVAAPRSPDQGQPAPPGGQDRKKPAGSRP